MERRTVQNGAAPNVVLQSQAWGDSLNGHNVQNASMLGSDVKPAALHSTAPYRPDDDPSRHPDYKPRPKGREGKCIANDDTCKAWATRVYPDYCNIHGRIRNGKTTDLINHGDI
jgi:hypothetical protein